MPGQKIYRWLRAEWRMLKASVPGRRFVASHERARPAGGARSPWMRPLVLVGAVICLLIGLVLAVMPGPAILFYALAAALLATQFRGVARWLDKAELVVRRWMHSGMERWRRWRGRQS